MPRAKAAPKKSPTFVEDLVDLIAERDGCSTGELATFLGISVQRVRRELRKLEQLGIVTRTGSTRGTRWHLG